MRTSVLVSTLALTFSAAPAFADDAEIGVEAPAFNSLDRSAQGSHAGAALSYMFIDGIEGDTSMGSLSRLDLDGAYVHESGVGAYGNLAVTKTFFDEDTFLGEVNEGTALSNLELGGVYQTRLSPELDLSAHLGVALPTSPSSDDVNSFGSLVSSYARLTDLVLGMPDTTWVRASVTPTYHKNGVFVRGDVGLDVGLDNEIDMGDATAEIDPIAHVNVGVGYATSKFAVSGELATMIDTGETIEDEERFFHQATLAGEYRAGKVTPHLAISSILDDEMRGEMITVTAGVKAGF